MPEATCRTLCGGANDFVETSKLEAKEWAQSIDQLKITLDIMYEICRIRQNIYGCEEALIYLKNAASDFTSLIDTIRIERDWENAENRPQALSWQVKGSLQRHSAHWRSTQCIQKTLKMVNSKTRGTKRRVHDRCQQEQIDNNTIHRNHVNIRKTVQTNSEKAINNKKSANCYANVTGGKITAPRSAMDLPQTKASMAKMAYSRLLLWQKRKKQLVEKLIARRRQQQSESLAASGRRHSLPALTREKRNGESGQNHKPVANRTKLKKDEKSNLQMILPNLESINEAIVEDEDVEDNSSTRTMAGELCAVFVSRSEPPCSLMDKWNLGICENEEWRAMTEEEESLAQEEESLKKELEEEHSVSVDEEVQRFVEDQEADSNYDPVKSNVNKIDDNCHPPDGWRPTWKEVVAKWKVKSDFLDSDTDALIVTTHYNTENPESQSVPSHNEQQEQQYYRKPGKLVQIRDKMLLQSHKRLPRERSLDSRQQKAEELRQQLLNEKSNRLRILHQKIEEVNRKRSEIAQRKREHWKTRMARAEENRQRNLHEIVRRAKEEEHRVMEISFINTLDAENVKWEKREIYERDIDRFQRRINELAEERIRKFEQKNAKELAAEERRRIAEEKRTEQLRQNCDRRQERLLLAEAQRNELRNEITEKLRNRFRDKEQKVDELRANELHQTQNLMNRIQQKHESSVRRYEETIGQVRQKAGEMCSPRLQSASALLADFSQAPADFEYATPNGKLCISCDVKFSSDLQLMSHLLSERHLQKVGQSQDDVDYEYFKKQLETVICDERRDVDAKRILQKQNEANNVKKRQKIKTKLSKSESIGKFYDDYLSNVTRSAAYVGNKGNSRIHKKVADLLKNKNGISLVIERTIFELTKTLSDATTTHKQQIAAYLQRERIPIVLIAHYAEMFTSNTTNASHSERILVKILNLIDSILAADTAYAASLLFSDFSPALCELFAKILRVYQCSRSLEPLHSCVLLIRTFCQLLSRSRQRANDAESASMFASHSQLILNYLYTNGFTEFMSEIHEKLQLKTTNSSCFVATKSGQKKKNVNSAMTTPTHVVSLQYYDDMWTQLDVAKNIRCNALDAICIIGSHLNPIASIPIELSESVAQSYASLFDVFLVNLYRHFCVVAHGEARRFVMPNNIASAEAGNDTVMHYSFHSSVSASSNTSALSQIGERYAPVTVHRMSTCLMALWNRAHTSSNTALLLSMMLKLEKENCVALRMTYCIRHIINFCIRETGGRAKPLMDGAILAAGNLAAIDDKMKFLCVLGWRRSLIAQLCISLPTEYLSCVEQRQRLMPTLISILYKNPRGIATVRDDFSMTHISSYLEDINKTKERNHESLPQLLEYLNLTEVEKFFKNL